MSWEEDRVISGADAAAGANEADLRLLRAFEPVIRFTRGELFFPMSVEPYVAHCSLWREESDGDEACVVPAGELSLERLCVEGTRHQDRPLQLRFVAEPLGRAAYRAWRRRPRDRLKASARFTTTGQFGRLIDAGFRASLLLRGKVAAGLAAAAEINYREHCHPERVAYYGHVVRTGGYICLQYWLFYAMNDWRSTFSGVNDHEADWEMVSVYLAEHPDQGPRPIWVAVSTHDQHGSDLRRRWDDPELRREGDHAVLFAGAGSHAGAFVPGDYVVSIDPPALRKPIAVARRVQRLLAPWREQARPGAGFGIPFVDYARGDGVSIGPGQEVEWTPSLITDDTAWVWAYRGLWGLDTKDRFGGERAPAGPRYEREGSPRLAWINPLGWAGLLGDPPPEANARALLGQRVDSIQSELSQLDLEISAAHATVRELRVQVRSLAAHDYAGRLTLSRQASLREAESRLSELIARRALLIDEQRTHLDTMTRSLVPEPPQAHLRHPHGPRTEEQRRRTRFLRLWAVVSTPLLIASPIVLLLGSPLTWVSTIAVLIAVFLGMEALARHRFLSFVASVALLAAVVIVVGGGLVLLRHHWRVAISAVLGAAALALLVGNVGDLLHRWHPRRGQDRDVVTRAGSAARLGPPPAEPGPDRDAAARISDSTLR